MSPSNPAASPARNDDKKRSRCESSDEEERQRLRDKNRTNSKRFRDRKKNYMDSLFEEKYSLGKDNNDLMETNQKLRDMLNAALAENQLHKCVATARQHPIRPTRNLDAMLAASTPTFSIPSASLLGGSSLVQPSVYDLLDELKIQRQKRLIEQLALRELELSLKSKVAARNSAVESALISRFSGI